MNDRRVNYRKKGDSVVLEGRTEGNKPICIWTLPDANRFILQIIKDASFLPKEKRDKIEEKYKRLGFAKQRKKKGNPKVPLMKIRRTHIKDADTVNTPGREVLDLSSSSLTFPEDQKDTDEKRPINLNSGGNNN